jgi:hypothetical protein
METYLVRQADKVSAGTRAELEEVAVVTHLEIPISDMLVAVYWKYDGGIWGGSTL